MTTWNDVRKPRADGYNMRSLSPETFKEGAWVCHSLSSRWFKLIVQDDDMVGGFGIRGEEIIVPMAECYHAWDPRLDRGKKVNSVT